MTTDAFLETISQLCQDCLGREIDVILHGSLAMGCFQPATSDVDLLIVTSEKPSVAQKKRLRQGLLSLSNSPYPIELSVVPRLKGFTPPAPFYFHYSERWRDADENEALFEEGEPTDMDLGAHFVIARWFGRALYGRDPKEALPKIPHVAYWEAILYDAEELPTEENPVYAVCTIGRILGYMKQGLVLSKRGGCVFGLGYAPEEFKGIFQAALDAYTNGNPMDPTGVDILENYLRKEIEAFTPRNGFVE